MIICLFLPILHNFWNSPMPFISLLWITPDMDVCLMSYVRIEILEPCLFITSFLYLVFLLFFFPFNIGKRITKIEHFWFIGYESDGSKLTIREQLEQLFGERDDDFTIPLGKNLKKVSAKFLTISQKRNIRRQAYLNEVSQRNDSVFFATIGAFVILPPFIILGIAILTGYVQLFPWNTIVSHT